MQKRTMKKKLIEIYKSQRGGQPILTCIRFTALAIFA
jgi:hypothetical protein